MYLMRMSDWSLAELEDIDWSVFGRTDDHIVPHRSVQLLDESIAPNVAHKKPQREMKYDLGKNMCSRGSSTKTVLWREEDAYYLPVTNGNSDILEGSQSHTSNMVVPTLCGLERTAYGSALPSQDGRILDYCVSDSDTDAKSSVFCSTDSRLGTMVSTNNGKYCLPIHNNATPDATSLSFLERQQKDRDNELAYYDWPDIGNFEDIDKLLRDTTIGQGQTGTADELSWFSSSSNAIYGSENAFEPDFQSSNTDMGVLHAKLGYHSTNANFLPTNVSAAADHGKRTYSKYADWLGSDASSTAKSVAKEKWCNEGDEKKKIEPSQITSEYSLNESGASDVKIESHKSSVDKGTKRSTDQMLLDSDLSAPKMCSSQQFSQQKHFIESSSSYMHNLDPHSQLEFGLPTNQVPFTQMTGNVKFEKGTNPSSYYQISDHIMNHSTQCLERFPDQIYMPQVMTSEKNIEKLYQRLQLSSTTTIEHPHQQPAFRSKASVHNKVLETKDDTEMEDVGLELSTVEIDHPVIQGSSGMISVSSGNSSEKVTSFWQLQDAMHQLDVKTKLCIRDSLYRLARSASQRNGFVTQNCSQWITDSKGIQGTEALKSSSAEFMDAETTTNPIDRSIAHLLFHKPSEPITMPADDTPLESHILVMSPEQFDHQVIFGSCGDMETDLP